jgi:hypothetical protein
MQWKNELRREMNQLKQGELNRLAEEWRDLTELM